MIEALRPRSLSDDEEFYKFIVDKALCHGTYKLISELGNQSEAWFDQDQKQFIFSSRQGTQTTDRRQFIQTIVPSAIGLSAEFQKEAGKVYNFTKDIGLTAEYIALAGDMHIHKRAAFDQLVFLSERLSFYAEPALLSNLITNLLSRVEALPSQKVNFPLLALGNSFQSPISRAKEMKKLIFQTFAKRNKLTVDKSNEVPYQEILEATTSAVSTVKRWEHFCLNVLADEKSILDRYGCTRISPGTSISAFMYTPALAKPRYLERRDGAPPQRMSMQTTYIITKSFVCVTNPNEGTLYLLNPDRAVPLSDSIALYGRRSLGRGFNREEMLHPETLIAAGSLTGMTSQEILSRPLFALPSVAALLDQYERLRGHFNGWIFDTSHQTAWGKVVSEYSESAIEYGEMRGLTLSLGFHYLLQQCRYLLDVSKLDPTTSAPRLVLLGKDDFSGIVKRWRDGGGNSLGDGLELTEEVLTKLTASNEGYSIPGDSPELDRFFSAVVSTEAEISFR